MKVENGKFTVDLEKVKQGMYPIAGMPSCYTLPCTDGDPTDVFVEDDNGWKMVTYQKLCDLLAEREGQLPLFQQSLLGKLYSEYKSLLENARVEYARKKGMLSTYYW